VEPPSERGRAEQILHAAQQFRIAPLSARMLARAKHDRMVIHNPRAGDRDGDRAKRREMPVVVTESVGQNTRAETPAPATAPLGPPPANMDV
jgi:hypothetical protein